MDCAYTPGPWTLDARMSGGWDPSLRIQIEAGDPDDPTLIAHFDTKFCEYPSSDKQIIANARLMASAPDFFVALETIASWPVSDHDNQDAVNMAVVARDALKAFERHQPDQFLADREARAS